MMMDTDGCHKLSELSSVHLNNNFLNDLGHEYFLNLVSALPFDSTLTKRSKIKTNVGQIWYSNEPYKYGGFVNYYEHRSNPEWPSFLLDLLQPDHDQIRP